MNQIFLNQRGKATEILRRWRELGVEQELWKSHFPGNTLHHKLLMLVSFFLSAEARELIDDGLDYATRMMTAYWTEHSDRKRTDGSPMPSDRGDAEIASYFIKSLSTGAIESKHLEGYLDSKLRWLEELNEVPPRSDDTDGVWRRMVLAALELGDIRRAATLFGRRRRYRNEQGQYAPLKALFERSKGVLSTSSPERLWHEYFLEARRRPAGCGKPIVISLDELLLVASVDQSGLSGDQSHDHWAALRALRGPEEIEA